MCITLRSHIAVLQKLFILSTFFIEVVCKHLDFGCLEGHHKGMRGKKSPDSYSTGLCSICCGQSGTGTDFYEYVSCTISIIQPTLNTNSSIFDALQPQQVTASLYNLTSKFDNIINYAGERLLNNIIISNILRGLIWHINILQEVG